MGVKILYHKRVYMTREVLSALIDVSNQKKIPGVLNIFH